MSSHLLSDQVYQRNAREYLRSLRQTILVSDVPLDLQFASERSLVQGVIDRLRREPAQLVVRTRGNIAGATMSFARQLVLSGTPVMLTQGQPWQPIPRFMTALVVDSPGGGRQRRPLAPSTSLPEMLGRRCGAHLDYVAASAQVLSQVIGQSDYDLITLALDCAEDLPGCSPAAALPGLSCTGADMLFIGASHAAENADAREHARI